eukprot:7745521-Alexandrium_andersonii.AAC.1
MCVPCFLLLGPSKWSDQRAPRTCSQRGAPAWGHPSATAGPAMSTHAHGSPALCKRTASKNASMLLKGAGGNAG